MSNKHLTYPHSTITEAICDIYFCLPPGQEWKPSFPGELFKQIQNEYPEMEPLLHVDLQLEVGPQGATTRIGPQHPKVRFKHKTHPLVLQLAEHSLSISALAPYQGWDVMCQNIVDVWEKVREITQSNGISRIGLRYINQIVKSAEQDRVATWLVANDQIPKSILASEPGFLLRVETRLNNENRLIVTLGDTEPKEDAKYGTIIFDIDRIVEKNVLPISEALVREAELLHADVWAVFSSAKGEQLEALLNGRIP